jgi:hypothetical protein
LRPFTLIVSTLPGKKALIGGFRHLPTLESYLAGNISPPKDWQEFQNFLPEKERKVIRSIEECVV